MSKTKETEASNIKEIGPEKSKKDKTIEKEQQNKKQQCATNLRARYRFSNDAELENGRNQEINFMQCKLSFKETNDKMIDCFENISCHAARSLAPGYLDRHEHQFLKMKKKRKFLECLLLLFTSENHSN